MPETRYITIDDVLAIADAFFAALDYAPPVLRGGGRELLDSALARPQMHAFYAEADLTLQAAKLCAGIAQNQPFVDGNKRAAFAACIVFLRVNGHPLHVGAHDELAEQIIALGTVSDRTTAERELARWLGDHTD
ncbi:MAG: type II toxin-antitoxin system death-on-curing family toxin [Chloroflexi bacterium]|nr:type II toxin-antitoxin system death-on-curing family toxin [Solirubrobacterales bacterium]MBV9327482.1 type II toxin-antitoxin system death-on-curing family toxin [Chloroflexota bacterium]MBV9602100.1 type II toxin-antitoxin system death-on-curing family toxin [Chloroflexota bacterium]